MTIRRVLVLLVAAALVGGGAWWWSGRPSTVQAGGTTVLIGERAWAGDEANIAGDLTVVDGCLGLNDYVVVWPHGTDVVRDDPLTLDVPGRGEIGLGDEVALAGGFVHEPPYDGPRADLVVYGVAVPEPCTQHAVAGTHAD